MTTAEIVLTYGPIIAANDELNILISVNGSYLNVWVGEGLGSFTNTDCRGFGSPEGWLSLPTNELIAEAERYLEEVIANEEANQ